MNQVSQTIFPVIRKAQLTSAGAGLVKKVAQRIANSIFLEVEAHTSAFIHGIKELLGEDVSIEPSNTSRFEEEGNKAFIIDFPVITVTTSVSEYEVRSTTAVCFKNSSTKNWTRVSLKGGIPLDDKTKLSNVKETFNKIADKCCAINREIFTKAVKNEFDKDPKSIGEFTILTFGITDKKLGKYLDLFDDIDLKLQELFSDEAEAKRLIESYYKSLFNENELTSGQWATSNVSFVNKDNILRDSNVLYKIEKINNNTIIEGIGYDESTDGIVAKISSLKVAKIIENILNPISIS